MKKLLVLLVGLVGCHASQPQTGWHIQHNTICFSYPAGVTAWKACDDLTEEKKTNCQAKILTTWYGQPFETTKVSVFYHGGDQVSKVVVMSGSHQGEVFYCPTVQVRR